MAQGSGTFHVDRYDRSADRAERLLLDEIGYTAVLASAATDPEGCYLLEMYADGDTRDLTGLTVSLSLLVRAAAANSASAMTVSERLRRRTRHITVTSAVGRRLAGAAGPLDARRGGGRGAARRLRLVADRCRPPDR